MTPTQLDYWRLKVREERKNFKGLDALAFSVRGIYRRRTKVLERFMEQAAQARQRCSEIRDWDDAKIREETTRLGELFVRPEPSDLTITEGLACVALASERVLGLSPHPVQLAGAIALFHGYLAEMATGEGKTLTVGLAAALQAMTRKPCHVITANDYLASRDSAELMDFYNFFGLKVGCVTGSMPPPERKNGYLADITYTTAKEVLADFLRDRLQMKQPLHSSRRLVRKISGMRSSPGQVVLRGLHFAIVDEADSAMIDEAVTPLIISQPVRDNQLSEAVLTSKRLAENLVAGVDYEVDFKFRDIIVPTATMKRLGESIGELPPSWRSIDRLEELVKQILVAREHYHRGMQYVVKEGKLELVDEFTGRIMEHRTWQRGMHQAIEAKENLEISAPNESVAAFSFQRFFRCYPRLSGLSGTAGEAREEFWQIYHLPVLKIPTNRPVQRVIEPVQITPTLQAKWEKVIEEIIRVHASGRPLLVGTRSIEASEELAERLKETGLSFRLLNARFNKEEAEIIQNAGQLGQITLATNMAGRGTDIKLGPGVRELGGLHVIATERHESGRIDRQLVGRAGRQGDPGSAGFILSLEDGLLRRYIPGPALEYLKRMMLHPSPRSRWVLHKAFDWAQGAAQRMAFRSRKRVLKDDTWMDENLSFAGKSSTV